MNPVSLLTNPELMIAFSAAISVAGAILVVAWPYFARDHLGTRMAHMANERERIRARERSRLNAASKPLSLRSEPKKLYKAIVDKFDLAKQVENGELAQRLRIAGYAAKVQSSRFLPYERSPQSSWFS